MNRRGFLGAIAALLAAPKAILACRQGEPDVIDRKYERLTIPAHFFTGIAATRIEQGSLLVWVDRTLRVVRPASEIGDSVVGVAETSAERGDGVLVRFRGDVRIRAEEPTTIHALVQRETKDMQEAMLKGLRARSGK